MNTSPYDRSCLGYYTVDTSSDEERLALPPDRLTSERPSAPVWNDASGEWTLYDCKFGPTPMEFLVCVQLTGKRMKLTEKFFHFLGSHFQQSICPQLQFSRYVVMCFVFDMLPLDAWFEAGPRKWFNLYVLSPDTTGFSNFPLSSDTMRDNSSKNLLACGQVTYPRNKYITTHTHTHTHTYTDTHTHRRKVKVRATFSVKLVLSTHP